MYGRSTEDSLNSRLTVVCAILCLLQAPLDAQLCGQWSEAVRIGELPPLLRESSGIAASRKFPDRLYHINDSGDTGRFYLTGMDGTGVLSARIADFKPRDTEALSLGPCPGRPHASCIYVGDIGDNQQRRSAIEIVAVEETHTFAAAVTAAARLTLRYPDGPHDADSMAVHPDGTIYILTKEHPARLFKARVDRTSQTLEPVATVDTGAPPTDMALSDDGTRAIVLTYQWAVELSMDLKQRRKMTMQFLQQQESVTYLPGSRSFVYTTEQAIARFLQPIMRMDCRLAQNPRLPER